MLSIMSEDKPWNVNLLGMKCWRSESHFNVQCFLLLANDSRDDSRDYFKHCMLCGDGFLLSLLLLFFFHVLTTLFIIELT